MERTPTPVFPYRSQAFFYRQKPKKAKPPHLGAGHERQMKTLQELGNAGRKSWEVGEEKEPHDPYL